MFTKTEPTPREIPMNPDGGEKTYPDKGPYTYPNRDIPESPRES